MPRKLFTVVEPHGEWRIRGGEKSLVNKRKQTATRHPLHVPGNKTSVGLRNTNVWIWIVIVQQRRVDFDSRAASHRLLARNSFGCCCCFETGVKLKTVWSYHCNASINCPFYMPPPPRPLLTNPTFGKIYNKMVTLFWATVQQTVNRSDTGYYSKPWIGQIQAKCAFSLSVHCLKFSVSAQGSNRDCLFLISSFWEMRRKTIFRQLVAQWAE